MIVIITIFDRIDLIIRNDMCDVNENDHLILTSMNVPYSDHHQHHILIIDDDHRKDNII